MWEREPVHPYAPAGNVNWRNLFGAHLAVSVGIESSVAASPLLGTYPLDKFSEVHQDECMEI